MKFTAQLQEGMLNLFASKLRSILALLGILVGTASVVAMVLGGELATNEALKQFKTLGIDLLAVSLSNAEGGQNSGKQNDLSVAVIRDLAASNSAILAVAPYVQVYSNTLFNGHALNGAVLGVTEEFKQIVNVTLAKGRFISDLDGYAFYCVIGKNMYDEMKKYSFADPIGQQIQVGNNIFTIIGVAAAWPENNFVYASIDNAILVPINAAMLLSKYAEIGNIILRLAPDADIDQTKNHIENYLQQYAANKHFFFRSAKEIVARMGKQSEILTIFLGLIGGISLLVGGIGVMNIMLVSVVERRREIGIRLAVGATSNDIRWLFLLEAVLLALVGGVLGVITGIVIAYVIAWFSHWEFTLFLLPPLVGFFVSTVTGIFFGFYPAHKAALLQPIDALRAE